MTKKSIITTNNLASEPINSYKGILLPWSANNGTWNGDMFWDWFRSEPSDDPKERYLWDFLHLLEENQKRQITKNILGEIKKVVEERLLF